uniref:C2H2-type domain-containing protein n=1 Tax=Musca domestica TaxID=7370 RepID=A0A1I8MAT9_MUSDO
METLNPPQPDTTTHVTETNLDSTSTQNSPQHHSVNDVETEDSNTQHSTEESHEEAEGEIHSKIVTKDGGQESNDGTTATTNIDEITGQHDVSSPQPTELHDEQKEEEEDKKPEVAQEGEQPEPQHTESMDISGEEDQEENNQSRIVEEIQQPPQDSMDTSEDHVDTTQSTSISQQQVEEEKPQEAKPQSISCTQNEISMPQKELANIDEVCEDKTTEEIQKFQYNDEEEDELLKSDEDEEEQGGNDASGGSKREPVSMEQEDALLKSDEEEETENVEEGKFSPSFRTTPMELDSTEISNTEEQNEVCSETNEEEQINKQEETIQVNEESGGERSSESIVTEKSTHRAKKNNPNHRILYKFDIDDDDDTSQESQKSKRSKIMEEAINSPTSQSRRTSIENSLENDSKEIEYSIPLMDEDQKSPINSPLGNVTKSTLDEDENISNHSSQSPTTETLREDSQDITQQEEEKPAKESEEFSQHEEAMTTTAKSSSPPPPSHTKISFVNESSETNDNITSSLDKESFKETKSWNSFDIASYLTNEHHAKAEEEIVDSDVNKEFQTPKLNGDHHHHESDHDDDMECQEDDDDVRDDASNHSRKSILPTPSPVPSLQATVTAANSSPNSPQNEATNEISTPINSAPNSPQNKQDETEIDRETSLCSDGNAEVEDDLSKIKSPIPSIHLPQNEEARIDFHNENSQEPDFRQEEEEGTPHKSDNSRMSESENEDSENETDLKIHEETQNNNLLDHAEHKESLFLKESQHLSQYPQTLRQLKQYSPSPRLTQAPPNNPDDETSRASMLSSASYSTSSSQQLVIDHPMDDVKEEKIKPLKICLKRKLSYNSDEDEGNSLGPKQKQMHLNEDQEREYHFAAENTNETPGVEENGRADKSSYNEMSEALHYNMSFPIKTEINDHEHHENLEPMVQQQPAFKSLLLQQLEKPIMAPNAINQSVFATSLSQSAPMEITSPIVPQTVPPFSPPPNVLLSAVSIPEPSPKCLESNNPLPAVIRTPTTKYLCFKCKTGSFASLAALTEHQAICLSQHSLFPMPPAPSQVAKIATPPPSSSVSPATTTTTTSLPIESKASAVAMPLGEMPANTTAPVISKKRFYKCSSCNTFHENWNLFLHIREIHNRYMCMYCVRFFPTAEKLALHLEIKHDLEQTHFNSEESLRKSIPHMEGYPLETRFLMCCTCEHVFKENDQFSQHDCSEYMKPCALCGQKGRHTNQCKAHPDSKRFSKLKKKKEKTPSPQKAQRTERPPMDFNTPPVLPATAVGCQFPINPPTTTTTNSNLNCDSGRVLQRPPAPPVLHSEDSNSSSNMVIDESCNVNNQLPPPPPPPQQQMSISNAPPALSRESLVSNDLLQQQQFRNTSMEIDIPPDRPAVVATEKMSEEDEQQHERVESPIKKVPPLRLVVPKFKLRVPKEFQKPVDDALSSSESEEADGDGEEDNDEEVEEEEVEENTRSSNNNSRNETPAEETNQNKNMLSETTPANSQDMERNSVTESATEAGNSQDDNAESGRESRATLHQSLSQDDDDSLDEPNSNLVRIMQEIERTKKDIKRTKKTSFRHNQNKLFAEPRQPTLSQSSIRTADHNWSPTPPASPNSRWFTPRRTTVSQSDEPFSRHRFGENEESLIRHPNTSQSETEEIGQLPQSVVATSLITTLYKDSINPPATSTQHVAQERRDTIGSDMMDIDETITAQPTQIIYGEDSKRASSCDDHMNTSKESADIETMETTQTTDNDEENPMAKEEEEEKAIQEEEETPEEEEEESNLPSSQNVDEAQQLEDSDSLPQTQSTITTTEQNAEDQQLSTSKRSENAEEDEEVDIDVCDTKEPDETMTQNLDNPQENEQQQVQVQPIKLPPADGIEVADDDTLTLDLQLDQPLDKYEIVEFVRICLKTVYHTCLYCNHARRIAVNGKSLVLHMIAEHRFTATVDSITAEELKADTIVAKLKSFLPDLENHYFNANSYCTLGNGAFTKPFNERIFECFQCRVVAATHKELYLHNRKMHLRTAILCFMCRANFFSFSEILCHICPGAPNKVSVFDVQFRCCLCELENIPSPFRLMVHLRKKHFACDVCLEDCRDQSKLSSHVWKHKLHHLCYRCGIAYRNKLDITKHLFWKHGTESTICKKCLQKKWPHVYHFCIPPQTFVCEVCNLCFSKAMYLRVHKRVHSGDFRYPCIEDDCEEKFISRKLLLKHAAIHLPPPLPPVEPEKPEDNKENMGIESKDSEVKTEAASSADVKPDIVIKKEPMDVDEQEDEGEMVKTEKQDEIGDKKEEKVATETKTESTAAKESEAKDGDTPRKKRKKSKRRKDLLEDLNFAAPNLSETDSSGDDSDSDSKTRSEIDAMPRVMLSPPSEAEGDEGSKAGNLNTDETSQPGKVLEIWQNFLKNQQGKPGEREKSAEPKENNNGIMYGPVHIALSDHDYCKLYELPPPPPPPPPPKETIFKKPDINSTPETSPVKQRKQSKSPRRTSRRSDASSSSSDSSSDSDSSCSCGSNCSCSSSNSGSSSSSSSSEETDSSAASNASVKKRHRKKSERDRMRKRSESASPLKQANKHSTHDVVNIDDEEDQQKLEEARPPSPPKEPLIYESDLETNESETDEEFYDEHPQKLATELLAQKRAQLMAQTRLSPSHNFDIVENSRPSTPSLPEEVASNERPKIKVKKKKRDRKSSCKGGHSHATESNAPALVPPHPEYPNLTAQEQSTTNVAAAITQASLINPAIDVLPPSVAPVYPTHPNMVTAQNIYAPPPPVLMHSSEQPLTPRPITMPPYGGASGAAHHRMSEGSSCSDVDGSLKRSKRARRPNKFYGYTSDDENIVNGPPLMIGSRAFKPQPPPQLTWRKEDLPTPSKSILNNKNKSHKTPKTPANAANNLFGGNSSFTGTSSGKKRSRLSLAGGDKSARKRPSKKKGEGKLPPIPTLKIRPSEIGLNTTRNHEAPKVDHYNTSDTSSDDDEDDDNTTAPTLHTPTSSSKSFKPKIKFVNNAAAAAAAPILPSQPPRPPSPQTKAFNHKIPPALLPNPDFATLQYFKANNIRYPIRPPAGARQAREGESVYCYCRCPYDEVSEMIACDGENCLIEWFHFECVGIMVAPQGKWFCAECRPKYSEELYPTTAIGHNSNV